VLAYIVRRLFALIPILLILTAFVFSIFRFLPGGPIEMMAPPDEVFNEEVRLALEKELGLDRPIIVQYADWLWRALHGDLGESIYSQLPVWQLIMERFPATLYLTLAATFLAIVIAIPLGTIAALYKNTLTDYVAIGTSVFGITVPNFWLALIMILLFSLGLRWLPSMGYVDPMQNFFGSLRHLAMPAVVLAVYPCAVATRMTRSSMLDELNKEYVYTARAQGFPEWKIVFKYTLKNALIPTLTVVGLLFARQLGGTIIIETIFGWPGIGLLIFEHINARDFPVLQAAVLLLAVFFVGINLVVDLLYRLVNPRVELT
jgi:peptide/nickel transport system permease protein